MIIIMIIGVIVNGSNHHGIKLNVSQSTRCMQPVHTPRILYKMPTTGQKSSSMSRS